MRTSPASGSIKQLMNLQVVVFPEPDAPTRATKLPLSMERERSLTAKPWPPSKDFETWSSSISGAGFIRRTSQLCSGPDLRCDMQAHQQGAVAKDVGIDCGAFSGGMKEPSRSRPAG